MKKIILLCAFALTTIAALPQGQAVVATMKASLTSSVDSVRSNGTTPVYLYMPNIKGQYTTAVFQATATRISAAMAGTINMEGSLDGTNWYNASNAAGDTITVANAATQTSRLRVLPTYGLPYYHYRLKIIGTTNDTMTVRAKFGAR